MPTEIRWVTQLEILLCSRSLSQIAYALERPFQLCKSFCKEFTLTPSTRAAHMLRPDFLTIRHGSCWTCLGDAAGLLGSGIYRPLPLQLPIVRSSSIQQ